MPVDHNLPAIDKGELLELLLNSVVDSALFAVDTAGQILTWSEGARRLMGYKDDEVIGRNFSIFYSKDDLDKNSPSQTLNNARERSSYQEGGWRVRRDGTRFWANIHVTCLVGNEKELKGFAVATYDQTKQRHNAERQRLIQDIAVQAATVKTFRELLQFAVSRIASFLGWPVGHALVWSETEKVLKTAGTWYFADDPARFDELVKLSETLTFAPGFGLPGRVFESKQVEFVVLDDSTQVSPRADHLRKVGIQFGAIIPILEKGNVIATLEFGSEAPPESAEDIIHLGEIVSTQVSLFMERQRLNEERETFFANSQDLICWCRYDGTIQRINPCWTEVLGYSEEDVSGEKWLSFVHPDDVDDTRAIISARIANEPISIVNRFVGKDGSTRWIQWHSVPLPDREFLYILGRDISEDKERESEIQSALSLRHAILNATSYAIISVDLEGVVRAFNPGAEEVFGYRADEFIGNPSPPPLIDLGTLSERAADLSRALGRPVEVGTQAFIDLAREGIQQEFEWTYVRKNGERFPGLLECKAMLDENGEMTGYVGIIKDISSRREAEAARERLLAVLEHSPDLIAFADQDGNVLYQNVGGNRLLGFPDDFDFRGRKIFDYYSPAVNEYMEAVARPTLRAQGVWQGENSLLHHDGTEIPVSQVLFFLPSQEEGRPYVANICRSMVEQKAVQARLAMQANDLRMSNQDLEQFAYVASHDLQEPLRMVCSFLGLLELEFGDKLNDDGREYIRYAMDGGLRMGALIDGLLDFSRVGRQNLEMSPVPFEEVFEEATLNLYLAIAESGAEVTHDPFPIVYGNKSSLVRLVQNLISNSLKFKDNKPPKIHIGVTTEEDGLLFSVKDNGIGIDPKHQEKIFMIFQRLHSKSKYPGSGIGLSICRKIVERHGGRIWLDPDTKEGSQFLFTLKGSQS